MTFCKEEENDETMYSPTICFNSKIQLVVYDLGIDNSHTTSNFNNSLMKVVFG